MAIQPGTRLGPYEILAAIGAGGMGEVYKARDTRLDRIVAIKVLPAHLADSAELRERFEREARTIASLTHPHICTLYDVGHQDGTNFLVMEYLEGETLGTRLLKGPLPLDQVLRYAIEIADALDKAHRKGVTHRDIKPGNIMLTKSGTKLLDFGLAKLKQAATPAATPVSQMPTLSHNPTVQGSLLGTIQYMAPEQVEGKNDEIDGRTDIFAFGVVVYEMATGKKAFEGKTNASVMSKIMQVDPPPMSSLQPVTPPALERVVKTCLAKEPDERWQTAGDLCRELKWIAEGGSQATPAPFAKTAKDAASRRTLIVGLGALLLGAAIAGVALWNRKVSAPVQPVTRLAIALPAAQQLEVLNGSPTHALALSPDGAHLAYAAIQGGAGRLFLRSMDSGEVTPMPDSAGATFPFFSPDGQWVGFFISDAGTVKLKKAPVAGGAAATVCDVGIDVRQVAGGSWGGQGNIVIGNTDGPLLQVSEAGGTPRPLTGPGKGEEKQVWPEFLPGGKAVLFTTGTSANPQIAVLSIASGERRNLVQGTDSRYASSGHMVYLQRGTLMAVPFDLQRLIVTGAAVPMVEGLLQYTDSASDFSASDYGLSATGTLVFVPASVLSIPFRLVWVSRNGAEQTLPADPHAYVQPRISPDGRRIAVGIVEKESQIWLYDLSRDTLTRFTFQGTNNLVPFWTPDGKRIAFTSNKEGARNLFWQLADGSGGLERLATSEFLEVPGAVSPDGQLLAFSEVNTHTGYDIWMLRLADHKAQPFLRTSFNENAPQFSPDGRWLAYTSDESGRVEIYVQPYPGPGGKWQISTEGGRDPLWNRNGRELFYRNGAKMMSVEIGTQPSFSAGTPKVLFEGQYQTLSTSTPNYDVSPDGQRFLMLKPIEQTAQINVVLNWTEELKQKVPTGKK